MGINQTLFMNGVGSAFTSFCQGVRPAADPGFTAWDWLRGGAGGQPAQVNTFVRGLLPTMPVSVAAPTFAQVGANGISYCNALNSTIGNLVGQQYDPGWDAAKQGAWNWFSDQPLSSSRASGNAPSEVIDWVENNLPVLVVVSAKGAKLASGQVSS